MTQQEVDITGILVAVMIQVEKMNAHFRLVWNQKKVLIIKMADTPLKNRAQWEIPSCFSREILRKMEI